MTGTSGLGRETINQLAQHGTPRIFFTGRNAKAADETIQAAKALNAKADVTFVDCDFSDLKSVAAAANRIKGAISGLDLLFCNAGIMAVPAALSKDGYEVQFAVNHIAHALLVNKLLPALQRTSQQGGDARVIISSSLGFKLAGGIAFDTLNTTQEAYIMGGLSRYSQSKLANILYSAELSRRHPDITFVSIHPGVIKTGIVTGLSTFYRYFTEILTIWQQVSVEEGVKNQLWAASTEKAAIENGAFYEPVGKPGVQTAASKDTKLAEDLYEWTEKAIAEY